MVSLEKKSINSFDVGRTLNADCKILYRNLEKTSVLSKTLRKKKK